MALTQTQIQTAFQNVLQRPASTSELNSYFAASQSGALSDSQVYTAIITSPEAAAGTFAVTRFYQAAFGRVPDQAGLDQQVDTYNVNGNNLKAIATGFTNSTEFTNRYGTDPTVTVAYLQALYVNVLGRTGSSAEIQNWLNAVATPGSGYSTRADVLFGFAQSGEFVQASNAGVVSFLTGAAQGQNVYTGPLPIAGNVGQIFNLTAGVDNITGTSANDTINAAEVASGGGVNATLTAGDQINGGAGNDTLNITQAAAFAGLPTGAAVSNIENVNITTAGSVTLNATTGFTGLANLNTTSVGGAVVTAGSATALNVTNADAAGGSQPITVNGGSTVNVVSTNNVGDVITVGGTTAAAGAVTVTSTGSTAGGTTAGTITVTGGTTVSVTQNAGNPAATGNTNVGGVVTVNGNASTTAVTVNQTPTNTGATATATTAGVVGFTGGQVVIADVNAASNTAAGTISTVSLNSFGAGSTINSSALTTLNLSGRSADLTVTQGALTTPSVTTQALNLNGAVTTGTVTLGAPITTLNVTGSTAASTLAGLSAAGVTNLNIAGDAKVTLTTDTFGALQNVVVTNTAGATLGTALATGTSFTGGTGADAITLTGGFTKAITTGAGNDTVTYGGAAGTGGSVNAGDGIDTIVMTAAQAAAASLDSVFNSKFTSFEVLSIATGGVTNTVDLAGINGVSQVTTLGQTALTINNMASGGTLTLTGASTLETVNVTNAALNTNDVFNINLSNGGATALAAGTVAVGNVETINIALTDTGTGANTAATIETLTLQATAAKSIIVSGNDGLTLTNTGNTAVTLFDASGVKANTANDTAANLAVTFTSANTTAGSAVTIIGGDGDDVLTGSSGTNAHTITGGNGADIITGSKGNDTIILTETVAARDTVVLATAANNGVDTITGFTVGTAATADAIRLVDGATTVTNGPGAAAFGETTNAVLTTGAQNFALTGVANTNAVDVVEINTTLSSFGNLGATNVVDGTELLKGLSSNNVAAAAISVNNTGDSLYLVAYQNNNAYVYQAASGGDALVTANEISLVGVINGVAQGALVGNNFTVA